MADVKFLRPGPGKSKAEGDAAVERLRAVVAREAVPSLRKNKGAPLPELPELPTAGEEVVAELIPKGARPR